MDRQLCLKEENSSSWFIYIKKLLHKYNLPSPQVLEEQVPSKDKWKNTVYSAVHKYWNEALIEDCTGKSTISGCNFHILSIGKQHTIWKSLACNTRDVRRGAVKVRLLTGTYIVQSTVSRFNQYQVDPTCLLCRSAPEDYLHMIVECGALLKYRKDYMCTLKSIIDSECGPCTWSNFTKDDILQLCIDCTVLRSSGVISVKESVVCDIERTARNMCYSIHCGRSYLLDGISVRKR